MKILYICLFVITVFISTYASARQLSFNQQYLGSDAVFNYTWQDIHGRQNKVKFRIPIAELERGMNEFGTIDRNIMRNDITRELKKYAKKRSKRGMSVEVKSSSGGVIYEVRGGNQRAAQRELNNLKKRSKTLQEKYIYNKFYTYIDDKTIMPDHSRIAARYTRVMGPIAYALKRSSKSTYQRDIINHILSFLQTIPYDTLRSRYTSNGSGFMTPYGIFRQNIGDCDSKSVAFAAILRNIYPSLRMAMVYTTDHAFIALGLRQQKDDWALNVNGQQFVLAEPVGPGIVQLGQVSSKSVSQLRSGDYTITEISF